MQPSTSFTLFLAAALFASTSAFAQSTQRVPAPPPSQLDVKTPAVPYDKSEQPLATSVAEPLAQPDAAVPRPFVTRASPIDHTRVYHSSDEGRLGARGASYKTEFAPNGFTYTPFFGARAARNAPLALSVASVSVGNEPIEFEAGVAAARSNDRVAFDRGAFVESYELAPTSIEQKFTFESLPRVGDLSVRILVDGDFAASRDAQGILFTHVLGTVRYGTATVVDANGASAPVQETLDGLTIVLTVPASFLADAAFPITIDPIVTTIVIDTTDQDDFNTDVAFEVTSNSWGVVYEETFSATDHDLFYMRLNANGTPSLQGSYIDTTNVNFTNPSIASNRLSHSFCVVAESGLPGAHIIRGLVFDSSSLPNASPFRIDDNTAAGDKLNPVVGGDPSEAAPTNYLVVWERVLSATDHDIHARLIDGGGAIQGSTIFVNNSGGTIDSHPAISKTDGDVPSADQAWNVVWQRTFNSIDEDILGARVRWDGVVLASAFVIDGSALNTTNPAVSPVTDVDFSLPRYLVVYERPFGDNHNIGATMMTGTTSVTSVDLSELENVAALDQLAPRVDTDGAQFAVTYRENFAPGFIDYDTYVTPVFYVDSSLGVNGLRSSLGTTGGIEGRASIAARHGGGEASHDFMCVWDRQLLPERDIFGGLFTISVGGPVSSLCFGTASICPCGNAGAAGNGCANSVNSAGARLTATGNASRSSDSLALIATNVPPGAPCLFFQGTQKIQGGVGTVLGDGLRCAGGTVIRLGIKPAFNGTASYPQGLDPSISQRGLIPSTGGMRFYQAWYRNSATFCTDSTFNLSNAMQATWVP
jgi:hypothetical protein